jgi:hypothetical protein
LRSFAARRQEGPVMATGDAQINAAQAVSSNGASSVAAIPLSFPSPSKTLPIARFLSADNTYLTALVAIGAAVPIVAAMVTVSAYVAPFQIIKHTWLAVPIGAVITLLLWLICAIPCRRFARACYANPCSYGDLVNQLRELYAILHVLDAKQQAEPNDPLVKSDTFKIALREIHTYCDDVGIELRCEGLCWLLATGYISMWKLVHHAEEALILVEPLPVVLNSAVHDELCLQDCNLRYSEELLDKLRTAVKTLSPLGVKYLTKQPRKQESSDDLQSNGNNGQYVQPDELRAELEARTTLREIHRTINEYRDSLWEGLILTRNRLMSIVVITGFLAYILLCLPILVQVDSNYLVSVAIFFLVGAILGLFNRLHLETQTNSAVNDYGLSMARVMATPVLSGLAAVGSVLVVTLLTNAIQKGINFPDTFTGIYAINPWNVILAAIFGLAPNLLVSMLQQKAEGYKSDIQSSKAS